MAQGFEEEIILSELRANLPSSSNAPINTVVEDILSIGRGRVGIQKNYAIRL